MTYKEAYDLLIREHTEDRDWSQQSWEAKKTLGQLIDRQNPKKPIEIHEIRSMDNEGNVTCEAVYYRCPVCNKSVQIDRGCSNNECRQAIDWAKD